MRALHVVVFLLWLNVVVAKSALRSVVIVAPCCGENISASGASLFRDYPDRRKQQQIVEVELDLHLLYVSSFSSSSRLGGEKNRGVRRKLE